MKSRIMWCGYEVRIVGYIGCAAGEVVIGEANSPTGWVARVDEDELEFIEEDEEDAPSVKIMWSGYEVRIISRSGHGDGGVIIGEANSPGGWVTCVDEDELEFVIEGEEEGIW